jgi:MOSC domain-containing protein YiiM
MDSLELRIAAVCTGQPQVYGTAGAAGLGAAFTSAMGKQPRTGPVALGLRGLEGDAVADTRHHGTPDQALLLGAMGHLPHFRALLGRDDVGPGAFGENLMVDGGDEASLCIGDELACGAVRLQVTQPRLPCFKQGRRWGLRELPLHMETTGRTGVYLRVVAGGTLEAGQVLARVAQPHPTWTVARANAVLHQQPLQTADAAVLAALPELGAAYRKVALRAAEGGAGDPRRRLFGS